MKKVTKKTNERFPLGIPDRHILNRVSYHLYRSEKIEKFSLKQWKEDIEPYFKGRCAYCGKKVPHLDKEHIVPINKDRLGLRCYGNIIPACSTCNQEKKKYDEKYDNGYVRFCEDKGYDAALDKIQQYMKDKGYKPFFADETKKKRIKKIMHEAQIRMATIGEDCAKKIAKRIIAEMKK
jgi:5-methylcytosine-specific restriction endonuclease McrA